MKTTFRLSDRLYHLLLTAYPPAFRLEYGEDMAQAFRDLYRDAEQQGMTQIIFMLWPHVLWDVLYTAIQQRLSEARKKRGEPVDTLKFDRQLGSTIEAMTVLLRSGYSVTQCMEMIADKSPEPTATAFKQFMTDIQSGNSALEALNNFRARVHSPHLSQVIETMFRQHETGGNLAEFLEPVAAAIRQDSGTDESADAMLAHFRQLTTAGEN